MNDAQRASFIEKGYFIVPSALTVSHVADLNAEYSHRVRAEISRFGNEKVWHGFTKPEWPRRMWSQPYYDLVNPPTIAPLLAELFSDPVFEHTLPGVRNPRFRLGAAPPCLTCLAAGHAAAALSPV